MFRLAKLASTKPESYDENNFIWTAAATTNQHVLVSIFEYKFPFAQQRVRFMLRYLFYFIYSLCSIVILFYFLYLISNFDLIDCRKCYN
jgi:hypothetical protein